MAYSQQNQYHMQHPQYGVNPINQKPHVVDPIPKGTIPTAINDIVLKQQRPKYKPRTPPYKPRTPPNLNMHTNNNNNNNHPNGYYPHQQPPPRRPYHTNKAMPPPVTASHKQHIKQNKPHQTTQHNRRNPSGSSSGPPLESSSEDGDDFVEEEVDENGQVVIIATDTQQHPQQPYYANNYNEYNQHHYNNGYQPPNTAYVPPYAYNSHGYVHNNNNSNSYGRPWPGHGHQPPPPLPKHKMHNYAHKATSKYENGHHNVSHYHPPPAQNVNLQFHHAPSMEDAPPNEDPDIHHKLSVASVASTQFATSFEQFDDDNILGDDNLIDPIHYDQRFSTDASNLVKHRGFGQYPPQQSQPPLQEPVQPQRESESDSNIQHEQARRSASNKNKGARPRYKHQSHNMGGGSDRDASSRSNSAPQKPHKPGVMSITVTKSQTESFISDNKPNTPSKSSRNGSETRESDPADLEILARDKDYRPSIVSDVSHNDVKLNVTIDRYGFPMDESMDEKEHRKQVKKENARLMKWQDMIFSKKSGGASAEEANETDLQIAHWNTVKNHRKLKPRIRKGVPQQLRGTVWQNLSGARERRKIECARYGSKNLYNDLRGRKKSKYHDQIWKDINRTYRKNLAFGASQLANASNNQQMKGQRGSHSTQKFFKNVLQDPQKILTPQDLEKNATPAQVALYNVLKGFSLYRRDIGYCQGMQAVTALLLMYMTEEEAFWVLASLADDTKYQMDNLWRPNMPAIQLRFYQMERLVKITLPKLSQHFERCCITSASMYQASQWFITIFLATDMKFSTITRVWDIYLNEGLKTVFRMGVGFLKYFEKPLLKSDFEEMLELFRTGGSQIDVDEYVKVCFSMRITHAQLAAFEKDFNRQQQQLKNQHKK